MKTISKILSIVLVLSMVLGFALIGRAAETKLATFTFPTNSNTTSWQDGNQMSSNQSFQDSGYTLTFTDCSNVYYKGNDGAGRGFIKFGKSQETGTLTFTVPSNVTKVELHLAKYKSNASYYSVNGGSGVALTKDGSQSTTASQYDVVSVNTSSNKTITLASTSSGKRMVLFSVIYYGSAPSCEHTNATYSKTMTGHTMDCPDCDDTFTEQPHTYTNKACSVCGYELYTPAHMDKVTIYYPSGDSYMSGTASGSKLAAGTAEEFVAVLNGSNYEFVNKDGKYLTSAPTGNGLSLTTASNEYSLWTLEEAEKGWYIKNVNALYNSSTAQYLEFYNGFVTYSLGSGGDKYTFLFEKTGVATQIPVFQCSHVDANSDYICDNGCGENVDPAADSTLTLEQANALGEAHSSYTTNKYYVSGTVSQIVSDYYGNLWIKDEAGNSFYIYGIRGANDEYFNTLDPMPVVGDVITLYGIIGQYNGDAQMKNGTLTAHVVHTCVDSDNDHECDICEETISQHKDDNKDHECDICTDPISQHKDDNKDHECDICEESISEHKDDNKDHECDNGCSVAIGDHTVDADKDHKCDYCKEVISQCEFNSADYVIDSTGHAKSCACGEVGQKQAHADTDNDGKCDDCEYELATSNNQNQNNTNNPKDGDAMSIISVVSTMILSMSGVVALVIKRKSF